MKDQNRVPLMGILGLNFVVLALVVKTGSVQIPDASNFQQWSAVLPAGCGVILAGVVNGLVSANAKARLVFWRWSNPMPGSYAFSRYAFGDPRINVEALRKVVGVWPSDPAVQNTTWYRLYKSVEQEPSVSDAHRNFLLMRDYAAISLILLITAGPIGAWFVSKPRFIIVYVGLLVVQFLAARIAAVNYGERFVTTVLALKSI